MTSIAADLPAFVVQLGAAMNAAGQPVDLVQARLTAVASAYGAEDVRVTAFPTYLMVTMGAGEPALLELTASFSTTPRLDQIAELDRLVREATRGTVAPADGLRRLETIRLLPRRFNPVVSIVGYSVLTLGICLILRPAARDVVGAAALGALVGVLRSSGSRQPTLNVLMPVVAAFAVSALAALAVRHGLPDPGLRAIVASLVVFLPGATLTTAVLELAAGQMISGAARMVAGALQLALLAFGIIAGIESVGAPASEVFTGSPELLGWWAPWLGVLMFAVGSTISHSAPRRSFPGLMLVLYSGWLGQVLGDRILGGYVGGLTGAAVMTLAAFLVSKLPSAMPAHASFLPGFWLLVPGSLGLINLAELAGESNPNATSEVLATVGAILAVALGVLCGTQVWTWALATGRIVTDAADSSIARQVRTRTQRLRRVRPIGRFRRGESTNSGGAASGCRGHTGQ